MKYELDDRINYEMNRIDILKKLDVTLNVSGLKITEMEYLLQKEISNSHYCLKILKEIKERV